MSPRELLAELQRAAVAAAHAGRALERALASRDPGPGPFVLLAAGKAACAMAEAAQRALGPRIARGEVTTKDGHGRPLARLTLREAAHPLPDARSAAAARSALELAASVRPDESLLVLLSGGASALWCAPAEGLTLADKRRTTELLLRTDAEIHELNTVRRHLSALKGGGLARAARGRRVRVFAVSDVRGDSLADLGSGPASADPTTFADALSVLHAHRLAGEVPRAVLARIERGAAGELAETLEPGDPILASVSAEVVASLELALAAAARAAEARGLRARVLPDALYGEVDSVARALAGAARAARADGADLVIAGGEPTVVVRGSGQGGRAQELALRVALALQGEDFTALCAGTDGSDGATSAAGAFSDATSLARASALRLDVRAQLARSDAHPLLAALGDLFVTGPTETNVADLALVLMRAAR
ncbi:MAG: glycerate kinase [Myxococcota bacterium]